MRAYEELEKQLGWWPAWPTSRRAESAHQLARSHDPTPMIGKCPDQLKLPFALWTREAIGQLIARKTGLRAVPDRNRHLPRRVGLHGPETHSTSDRTQ